MRAAGWLPALVTCVLCPAATLLRGPYLQNVGRDHASIVWVTREPGVGVAEYAASNGPWRRAAAQTTPLPTAGSDVARYQHQADLSDLIPGENYRYRVLLDGELLKDGLQFRTAAAGPFDFLVIGDSGTGSAEQTAIAQQMSSEKGIAFVLHTGDISQDDGALDRLEAHYFAVYGPLMSRLAFFPCLGNHDYGHDLARPYLLVHVLPTDGVVSEDAERYYSFDWGDAHFVSLDTNLLVHPAIAARMLGWLERDLQRTQRFWRVAFFHHPPYPSGHHRQDPISQKVRELVMPVLESHGVQLTLSGHEHNYQRSRPMLGGAPVESDRGVVSIITGGGGAALHPVGDIPELAVGEPAHHYLRIQVEGMRMTITAIALGGRVIDRATLAPLPRLSAAGVVNAASYTARFAPGSLVSLFGANLALEETRATKFPLPSELGGAVLTLNGQRAALYYASPRQINAQLPYGVEGRAMLRISTPNGFQEVPLTVVPAAPAIARVHDRAGTQPAIFRYPAGVLAGEDSPAMPEEVLIIYLVGLGAVEGRIAAGEPAPSQPPLKVRVPVEVRAGEFGLPSLWSGLVPGLAGLYQVNVRIPSDLPAGLYRLRVIAGGFSSEPEILLVGEPAQAVDGAWR